MAKSAFNPYRRKKMRFFSNISGVIYDLWHTCIEPGASPRSNLLGENAYKRSIALVLGCVTLALLSASVALDIFARSGSLPWLLPMAAFAALISIGWIVFDKKAVYGPILLTIAMLMTIGMALLLKTDLTGGESLIWFILLPPMLVFCLGVYYGLALFAAFYAFLLLILFGPLHFLLLNPMPFDTRLRFALALFGSCCFAWFVEWVRHKTNQALTLTITRLERESLTDPLTGLGNRRDFQNSCAWIKAKSRRVQMPFSLAMIDIDHFKKVNDIYGHEIGDKVLVHITQVITGHMRATDRLFRWGGEEFIMLMPDTWPRDARQAAERIRQVVKATPYMHGETSISYSISAGLYCSNSTPDVNEALAEADRYLYMAKHRGRNQVVGDCSDA